jgi:hypothetical protein
LALSNQIKNVEILINENVSKFWFVICFLQWYIGGNFFNLLIVIVGGGIQLGSLGTAATNRPIVSAPGDNDNAEIGGIIGKGNRSTRRKPAPVPLCPP